jgi:hypothetical protein
MAKSKAELMAWCTSAPKFLDTGFLDTGFLDWSFPDESFQRSGSRKPHSKGSDSKLFRSMSMRVERISQVVIDGFRSKTR